MTKVLHIADLAFEVRLSSRRKTLGLTVDRGGELVVHAPEETDEEQLRQWINKKLLWVHRKLAQKADQCPPARAPEFVSGESIFYLGRSYRLKLVTSQPAPLQFDGEWFTLLRRERGRAAAHFRDWFIEAGGDWITHRAKGLLPKTGGGNFRVKVGDLGYRWGSCGKNGVLHFNWRLFQLPVRLIDYVIAHELVHREERNHTRQFWRMLERAMPDCRARQGELEREWHSYAAFAVSGRPSK